MVGAGELFNMYLNSLYKNFRDWWRNLPVFFSKNLVFLSCIKYTTRDMKKPIGNDWIYLCSRLAADQSIK